MLFMSAIETQLTTVPYKGTGPALTDLIGGQVDFMCDQTTNTTNQIKAGKIKAYAVTTAERLDALPDVPTAAEGGLDRSEEHTSELQSLMRISYAVFCLKQNNQRIQKLEYIEHHNKER